MKAVAVSYSLFGTFILSLELASYFLNASLSSISETFGLVFFFLIFYFDFNLMFRLRLLFLLSSRGICKLAPDLRFGISITRVSWLCLLMTFYLISSTWLVLFGTMFWRFFREFDGRSY